MRGIVAALLLPAVAFAGPPDVTEPDAAVAEAARWVEPRGCASGSFRSRALPIVSEIEEAWRLEFEAIVSSPVHWDGTGYVVVKAHGKPHLVAFDLVTGKEVARTLLDSFSEGSGLLVWDQMVLLQPDDERITGYMLQGGKFRNKWTCHGVWRDGRWAPPRQPVVHDNEIYCLMGYRLGRFRPAASSPSWCVDLGADYDPQLRDIPEEAITRREELSAARPIVCGPYVFLAWFAAYTWKGRVGDQAEVEDLANLWLSIYRRSNGERVLFKKIATAVCEQDTGAQLHTMIAGDCLIVRSHWRFPCTPLPGAYKGLANQLILRLSVDDSGVHLVGEPGLWTAEMRPCCHPRYGVIQLARESRTDIGWLEWQLCRDGKIYALARESEQRDLFRDRVTPTVLGDVVYFGSWAADIETGEILWRLPLTDAVTYPVVPADRLALVVEGGRTLRAFRGRGKQ